MSWLAIALAVTLSGCSHYGFADEPAKVGHNQAAPVVSVWTVATLADEGIDAARLTRALAGALEQRGIPARWRADSQAVSVRCSVAESMVDGLEEALFAWVQVRCLIERRGEPARAFEAAGHYSATTRVRSLALVHSHAALQEAAALDALETLAERIARWHLDAQ